MKDFRFGTLAFLPTGDLREVADNLRGHFDPASAATCAAHVTLTQPFSLPPAEDQIQQIESTIRSTLSFQVQIGPATTSPNKRLVWLDVSPKDHVLALRDALHETGLFRLDLPLTRGFIPHLTISEAGREPEEVDVILDRLNTQYRPWHVPFDSVAWIIPDENFVLKEHRSFRLRSES